MEFPRASAGFPSKGIFAMSPATCLGHVLFVSNALWEDGSRKSHSAALLALIRPRRHFKTPNLRSPNKLKSLHKMRQLSLQRYRAFQRSLSTHDIHYPNCECPAETQSEHTAKSITQPKFPCIKLNQFLHFNTPCPVGGPTSHRPLQLALR